MPHGPVRRTDTPLLAMARREGDHLRLSVADPDLRLPKRRNMGYLDQEASATCARPARVEVQLHGAWQLAAPHADATLVARTATATTLACTLRHGATCELLLHPAQAGQ